mgnify:CR=1 FL=1
MSLQFSFIKSIKNDKFVICALIDNFCIFERFKNFIIFITRIYFDVFNIFFVKYVSHKKLLVLFCRNCIKKYLIKNRGGQGIDHTHERNRGKRITRADCDIYVAVDKQVGICYLIPMSFADTLSDDECNKVRLEQVQNFKENWEIIKEVAKAKRQSH